MKKFLSGLVFFIREWFRPSPLYAKDYDDVRNEALEEKRKLHERFRQNSMEEEARQDPDRAGDVASSGDSALSRMLEGASGGDSSGPCSH